MADDTETLAVADTQGNVSFVEVSKDEADDVRSASPEEIEEAVKSLES